MTLGIETLRQAVQTALTDTVTVANQHVPVWSRYRRNASGLYIYIRECASNWVGIKDGSIRDNRLTVWVVYETALNDDQIDTNLSDAADQVVEAVMGMAVGSIDGFTIIENEVLQASTREMVKEDQKGNEVKSLSLYELVFQIKLQED